jgi:hypothetical protein
MEPVLWKELIFFLTTPPMKATILVPLLLREKRSWGRLSVEADLGPIPVVNKERWRHLFSDGIRAAALKKAGGGRQRPSGWVSGSWLTLSAV